MPPAFQHGTPVRIVRPGRLGHGHLGRYLTESPVQGHAEVCFTKGDPSTLPHLARLHNQEKCPRKIIPFSQLEPYDA